MHHLCCMSLYKQVSSPLAPHICMSPRLPLLASFGKCFSLLRQYYPMGKLMTINCRICGALASCCVPGRSLKISKAAFDVADVCRRLYYVPFQSQHCQSLSCPPLNHMVFAGIGLGVPLQIAELRSKTS